MTTYRQSGSVQARCASCGVRADAPPCPCCGATQEAFCVASDAPEERPHEQRFEEVYPALRGAFGAWRHREYARYVGQCLHALGIGAPLPVTFTDGTLWPVNASVSIGVPVSLWVGIDEPGDVVFFEVPTVSISKGHVAPMLRAALEMSAHLPDGARLAARNTELLLRFAAPVASVPPQRFVRLLATVARLACDVEVVLTSQFPCRGLIGPTREALQRGGHADQLRGKPVEMRLPKRPSSPT